MRLPTTPATFLITLALLAYGSAADAANRYVRPDGSASWANATSWSSPSTSASLSTANSNASPGDVVMLMNGDYASTPISPANDGTGTSCVTFVGNPFNPAAVRVGAISLINDSYISVKGVRAAGSLELFGCQRDSVKNCIALGELRLTDAKYNHISNCTIGDDTDGDKWIINEGVSAPSSANEFYDNTLHLAGSGQPHVIQFNFADSCKFYRNRMFVRVATGPNQARVRVFYNCGYMDWRDNYILAENNSPDDAYILNLRAGGTGPGCRFNTFLRDTMLDHAGTNACKAMFATEGGGATERGNTYTNCYIKVRGTIGYQYTSPGDRHFGGVYITQSGFLNSNCCGSLLDSVTIRHSTIASFASGATAVDFDNSGDANNTITFRKNIVYSAAGAPCPVAKMPTGFTTARVDSNLVYAAGNPTGTGTAIGQDGGGCAGLPAMSIWGDPGFTDATWTNFNPRIRAGGKALWGNDEYVGAMGTPNNDVMPPAAIHDLR